MPLDAVFDAVAHVGECDLAVGHLDAADGRTVDVESPARLADELRYSEAFTQQRLVKHRWVMTSSLICGRPDHTLESVMSAWTLSTVSAMMPSRSLGSCSVTSFSVTFSVGHRPILAGAAIDSR